MPGVEVAKCDTKSAFCLLTIHLNEFELLGFAFEGCFYVDRALPMAPCAALEKFRFFLEWALHTDMGLSSTSHFLNVFGRWVGHRSICLPPV